jgi:hypothetical protein
MKRTGLSKHGNWNENENGINNEKYKICILNNSNAPILINRFSVTCQFDLICVFFILNFHLSSASHNTIMARGGTHPYILPEASGDDEYSHIIHPIQSLDTGRDRDEPASFSTARV